MGWIFPMVAWVQGLGIYLAIYRYHIRLHPFIQRYNSKESKSHWTGFKVHPTIMIEFCEQTDMENHFGQDDTITDDNDQSHNWSNQDQTRPCSFNNILKRCIQWYFFVGPPDCDWFDNIITDQWHFGVIKDNHYMIQQSKQTVGYHMAMWSLVPRKDWMQY